MDRMEPVDEQKFEVATDVHGVTGGPRLGRQRVINKVTFFHCYIL
jgi:BRCA1-associated RING domain protein 1